MNAPHIRLVEEKMLRSDVPDFRVGDRVEVHQRILEGPKERIQVFEGDVIARHNGGVRETVTVRRLVQSEGVERIFPIHSPRIAKIVVKKAGSVRRAKLYYLRDRVGKATKIRDDVKRQTKIDADPTGEIDLIAVDGQTLVVVEVRSTGSEDLERTAASVDLQKQRRITDAALRFLARKRLLERVAVRFDVLVLSWPPTASEPTVRHIPHAFEAVGRFQMFN